MVVVNIILLNLLWLATVLGAANGILWPAALMLLLLLSVIFIYQGFKTIDVKIIVLSLFCGLLFDGFLHHQNTLTYASMLHGVSYLPPAWIMMLWLGFGSTVRIGMQWLLQNPFVGGAIMLIGAPLSYVSAAKLGAVVINDLWQAMTFIGITWLVYFIILVLMTQSKEARKNVVA